MSTPDQSTERSGCFTPALILGIVSVILIVGIILAQGAR